MMIRKGKPEDAELCLSISREEKETYWDATDLVKSA